MSNKRDRQGVRTPAQLEQKYSFGNDQKAFEEMRRLNAQFTRTVAEMRALIVSTTEQLAAMEARIAALTQEFILAAVISTEGVLSLKDTTYTDLKTAFDGGRCIVVYIDQADGTRRYYYCMGTIVENAVTGLLFQYGYGAAVEYAFIGEDGGIAVTSVSLSTQTTEEGV